MRTLLQPTMKDRPSVRCNGCSAALLISGLLGGRQRDLGRLHNFVVMPLTSFGFAVETFACFNTSDAELSSWWQNTHHHLELFTGKTRMIVQTARLASCWNHAIRHSTAFDLFIYCRPDLLWWDSIQVPSLDHVVIRAREIKLAAGEQIYQQQISIPCKSTRLKAFRGAIERSVEGRATPDDCFFVDDQLALVPARFAGTFFNGSLWRGAPKICDLGIKKGCSLPILQLATTKSTEQALTERLQQSCIPTMIHAFNVSIGLKSPKAPNARPGGPGEVRTVDPQDVWTNSPCTSVTPQHTAH